MKAKLILVGAIAVIAMAAFAYTSQGKAETSAKADAQQIAELDAKLASIKDKKSQEYKETKAQFCELRSRPAAEREQAVANIREFLGKPNVEAIFDCGRGNLEYYDTAGWTFIIDPAHNNIIEMGQAQTREKDDPRAEYDYTPRYNAEEAGDVAEQFITAHQSILAVDVTKMTRQYEGTKDGGDGVHPGQLVNYFYTWRTKDVNGKTTELVAVTITRGGQIVVFDNDTYDLAKN
jgi:hypothetical protein